MESLKSIKLLFSAESIFFCFLFSGAIELMFKGLDLTAPLFALSIITGLYRLIKKPYLFKDLFFPTVLFGLFAMFILISYLYTSSSSYGLDKIIRLFSLTSWSFIGVFIIIRSRESAIKFFNAGILVTVIICLVSLISFNHLNYTSDFIYTEQLRVGNNNAIGLARLAGTGTLLLMTMMLFQGKSSKLLSVVGISLSTIVLFLTGSRMPLISLLITILLIVGLAVRINKSGIVFNKGILWVLLISMGGIITAVLNWNSPKVYMMRVRLEMLVSSNGNLDASSYERMQRFDAAKEMFFSKPFLGHGIGSFSMYYDGVDLKSYPHNIFLELLSEVGLLPFVIFTVLLIITAVNFVKALKRGMLDEVQLSTLAILAYAIINANVTGDINDNRVMFAFLAIGLMMPHFKKDDTRLRTEKVIKGKRKFKRYKLIW